MSEFHCWYRQIRINLDFVTHRKRINFVPKPCQVNKLFEKYYALNLKFTIFSRHQFFLEMYFLLESRKRIPRIIEEEEMQRFNKRRRVSKLEAICSATHSRISALHVACTHTMKHDRNEHARPSTTATRRSLINELILAAAATGRVHELKIVFVPR